MFLIKESINISEDCTRTVKNTTLFTAAPCPSCSTLTFSISRVTGGIIVAVTGLTAARAIDASFTCYSKTDIDTDKYETLYTRNYNTF